jgi:hypothetical protein
MTRRTRIISALALFAALGLTARAADRRGQPQVSHAAPAVDPGDTRYVDYRASSVGEDGTSAHPFNAVTDGVLDVPAGGALVIHAGTYAEKMILSKSMELRSSEGTTIIGLGMTTPFLDCASGATPYTDEDCDGIIDSCEQALAEKYAPIVYHSSDESNLPVNVDWFLPKTSLNFYDDGCTPDFHEQVIATPTQQQLLGWAYTGGCGSTDTVRSDGTRSESKQRTFYLADVAGGYRGGSQDTRDWITYVHAYPVSGGGVTIQYWRFYAYNDAFNDHGGDWEGIHLVLDNALAPASVGFMGHTSIDYKSVSQLNWEGNHPVVFSEGGGHATRPSGGAIEAMSCLGLLTFIDTDDRCTFIRQETWKDGHVTWCLNNSVGFCDGRMTTSGGLLNLGAKLGPMNNQWFLKYSGIWGSPGTFFYTSGYWGPAYNETGMNNGFITAWCAGITGVDQRECYPTATTR